MTRQTPRTSKWTFAQVPAWLLWLVFLALQGGVLYFCFQYDVGDGAETPKQAEILRNICLGIAAVCLLSAVLIRWLGPWMLVRSHALQQDSSGGGWRLLLLFAVTWVLCFVVAAVALIIYLVSHDRGTMLATWGAGFVATVAFLPRWSGIWRKSALPQPSGANEGLNAAAGESSPVVSVNG